MAATDHSRCLCAHRWGGSGFPIASTALGKLAGEAMEERIHVHKMTQEVEHRVSHDAQGVFAVADLNSCRDLLGRVPQTPHPFLAAFWQMRDPGNAGTVIRSADAAGCDAVVLWAIAWTYSIRK